MSLRQTVKQLLGRTGKPYRLISYSLAGRTYQIPVLQGSAAAHQRHQEREVFAIYAALMEGNSGAFVDVGANVGQTLLKAKCIDPARRYIGFEPSPLCVYAVDVLITENGLSDCTIVPVALSDRASTLTLHFNSQHDAAATTVADFWSGENRKCNRRTILVQTGDSLIETFGVSDIALIKIDVEGAELEALRGLSGTIGTHRPHIVMEVLPASCAAPDTAAFRKGRIDELRALLDGLNYRSFRLGAGLVETREFDAETFDPTATNYLLAPMEASVSDIAANYAKALAA